MTRCRPIVGALVLLLAGCGNTPPAPDWQMNAKGAMERAQEAYLSGNARVEAAEFARARAEVARTGRADLLARLELARCATRVASLVLEPCSGFDALGQDAAAPERVYAGYLGGLAQPQDAAALPEQHRPFVVPAGNAAASLQAMSDPLARLVAAGVLLQTRRADPAVIALAIDTASAQGWRRPLLAWLGVQLQRAESGGDSAGAAQIRRRMALVGESR
ncbi:MAG: hypothetical protein KA164_19365 [Rhodoferax sp.]|nr:hypothetical protein [Rhodoferax sp.]